MKLNRNKLFSGILLFGLASISLVLLNIQFLYLRAIFSFLFLTTIPGLLIMLALKVRNIGFWEYLVYTVGLSISFLMFGGLAVNWILPLTNLTDKPLSLVPLTVCFSIILFIFGTIAYVRNKDLSLKINIPKLNTTSKVFLIIPIIFPILSILGAITLNNGGPNYLTMILYGAISVYVFLLIIFRNKLHESIYPYSIIFLSVSLLLSYSLRSQYLIGFDIAHEMYFFHKTNIANYWLSNSALNIYNACLSITILPSIFSSILNISDELIFKINFQILFSLLPLGIYILVKKFARNYIAFLSTFLFITQIWFIQQMPSLIRQEIAFVYFVLFLLVMFSGVFSKYQKYLLFIIFGFSLIISHYSTAYVWLIMMIVSNLIYIVLTKIYRLKFYQKPVSFTIIFLMISFLTLWYAIFTNSSSGLRLIAENILANKNIIFSEETLRSAQDRLLFKNLYINTDNNVVKSYTEASALYKAQNYSLFNLQSYKDYEPSAMRSFIIEPKINYSISILIWRIMTVIKFIITNILPILGLMYLLFKFKSKKENEKINYISICLASLPLIFLLLFLPFLKTEYNLTRLYLQFLIVLAYPATLGGLVMFSIFRQKRIYFYTALVIIFFLYTSGFLLQFIGGNPSITLNNYGEDYDKFYIHNSEVASATWLSDNKISDSLIYADEHANLRLSAYGEIKSDEVNYDIFPSTIDKYSYVYLNLTNVNFNKTYRRFDIDFISYNLPKEFLSENKNLIYSNGESEIYK